MGIAYVVMRKIHCNVMRFQENPAVDEAQVLVLGRFSSVSARHYVLHDPEKLSDKHVRAWMNFNVNLTNLDDRQ
jgi:deferrochelatase/peroxidase EfeB